MDQRAYDAGNSTFYASQPALHNYGPQLRQGYYGQGKYRFPRTQQEPVENEYSHNGDNYGFQEMEWDTNGNSPFLPSLAAAIHCCR